MIGFSIYGHKKLIKIIITLTKILDYLGDIEAFEKYISDKLESLSGRL